MGLQRVALFAAWVLCGMGAGASALSNDAPEQLPPPRINPDNGEPFPVLIRKPEKPPVIETILTDAQGDKVTISTSCAVCHTTKPVNGEARLGVTLNDFHQGVKGKHGDLTCASCHNPAEGYGSLRLSDGKAVVYAEVMTLCAQCHGPQYRDYQRGAHGGMTGFWDRTKGPRTRNNCIDCHAPHAPAFGTVRPAPGPNDRFLPAPHHAEGGNP